MQDYKLEISLSIERAKNMNEAVMPVTTLLLTGEPGGGKTTIAQNIVSLFTQVKYDRLNPSNYIYYQCHSGTMPQHLIFDLNTANIVEKMSGGVVDSVVSKGVLVKVIEQSLVGKVVFCLDELDKAPREVDAFLLDFLQDFKVNDPIHGNIAGNKKNCIVVITSNDERTFIDALYRRCTTVDIPYPEDKEMLKRLIANCGDTLDSKIYANLIKYFNLVRSHKELERKPTISEMMNLIYDYRYIKDRANLDEIIVYRMSPFVEDREFLIKNKIFYGRIKN